MQSFPDDENGDVLRRLQESGDDLTKPRDIDFTVVFPEEAYAKMFAASFVSLGFKVTIERTASDPASPWDVLVVKHMLPLHDRISEFEKILEMEAHPLGGRNDGWGCMTQPVRH